ncbi:MAG TPA: hypothetical protein VHG10_07085 [Glycomyces sp.]|nr:hypothetical protein [Glycomyces sp.]
MTTYPPAPGPPEPEPSEPERPDSEEPESNRPESDWQSEGGWGPSSESAPDPGPRRPSHGETPGETPMAPSDKPPSYESPPGEPHLPPDEPTAPSEEPRPFDEPPPGEPHLPPDEPTAPSEEPQPPEESPPPAFPPVPPIPPTPPPPGSGPGQPPPAGSGYSPYAGAAMPPPPPPPAYNGDGTPHGQEVRNGLGTAALVCGIIAIAVSLVPVINWFTWPLGVLAIVFGAIGWNRANKGAATNRTIAITGLVLGVLSFFTFCLIYILIGAASGEMYYNAAPML